MGYSKEQRLYAIEVFYRYRRNASKAARAFMRRFDVSIDERSLGNWIRRLAARFEETESLHKRKGVRPKAVRSQENIDKVSELFQSDSNKSIRQGARELGLTKTSVHRILTMDLKLFPYKIQTHQLLTQRHKELRLFFGYEMMMALSTKLIPDIACIWFSDEAHFDLYGNVSRQNFRFWGAERPTVCQSRPLHSPRVTVWCALSAKGIIGPKFIDSTVDSTAYCNTLNNYFLPHAHELGWINDFWFQQDGATCHRTQAVFDILNAQFGHRVISLDYPKKRKKGIAWPANSPDLSPLDFFLWGYVKEQVYRNRPETIDQLKSRIESVIGSISIETLESTIANFWKRLKKLVQQNGSHFEHIYH